MSDREENDHIYPNACEACPSTTERTWLNRIASSGEWIARCCGWVGKLIIYPLLLLIASALWLPWLLVVALPLPREIGARWSWRLRRNVWDFISRAKFKGNKPVPVPHPGRLAWWRWPLVVVFGKTLNPIKRVPFNSVFPDIPISNIQVAGHEPADEWDPLMKFVTWVQVTLYRLFPPMQDGLPEIATDPYQALQIAYPRSYRKLFDAPLMPPEYQGSLDLGALAVQGPYACYLQHWHDNLFLWDFQDLGAKDPHDASKDKYEYHPGLYKLGVRVIFRRYDTSRTLRPVEIETELGVSTPNDSTWQLAKKLAICAATNHLSLVRHFNGIHLASAAHLAIATRNHLFPDHPLGRLLWPYIFRTQSSNRAVTRAQMAKGGDFDSIFSFTHAGLCALFTSAYQEYRFTVNDPKEDAIQREIRKAGFDTPTLDDLEKVFNLFYDHTNEYVNLYYSSDDAIRLEAGAPVLNWLDELNDPHSGIPHGLPVTSKTVTIKQLSRLLANFMYLVTVHHDLVGSFVWNYQLWAHQEPPRLYRDGRGLPLDVYQRLVNANLNLNVARTALMNDYSKLASTQYGQQEAAAELLRNFQRTLAECEAVWRDEPWHVWRVYPSMLEVNINA